MQLYQDLKCEPKKLQCEPYKTNATTAKCMLANEMITTCHVRHVFHAC